MTKQLENIKKRISVLCLMLCSILILSCEGIVQFNDSITTIDDIEMPTVYNTGYSGELTTEYTSTLTITEDGATYENFKAGLVRIDADNVTLRNFYIEGSGASYNIQIYSGHTGITLENGELSGAASSGILGSGFTARYLNIHDSGGDGIKVSTDGVPVIIENCYIHRLGTAEGSHADGVQMENGGSNVTFRYNNFEMPYPGMENYPGDPYKSNSCFIFGSATFSNILIDSNWLNGGNYTIYSQDGVTVSNNRFGHEYRYGLRSGSDGIWMDNKWVDTEENI